MELKNGVTVLFVRDAQRTRAFYESLLGFHVVADLGGVNIVFREGFALWQPDPGHPIPAAYGDSEGNSRIHDDTLPPRGELCYETEDMDGVFAALKEYGVRFLHELREESWGQRSVRFFDPDGHLSDRGRRVAAALCAAFSRPRDDAGTDSGTYVGAAADGVETFGRLSFIGIFRYF